MTREEAIHILYNLKPTTTKSSFDAYVVGKAITMAIKALEQEPKTGRWIEVIDEIDSLGNKTWHHKCSICGSVDSGWGANNYCPKCGAKMFEPQESEGEG